MEISKEEFNEEKKRLDKTIKLIRSKISDLGQVLYDDKDKQIEFKKYLWDTHTEMDPTEMRSMVAESDLMVDLMMKKGAYIQKLFRIQRKPYFGSIVFEDDSEKDEIYIGITHVEDNHKYYVHDWRSPICSLFYDYELGDASYKAPGGTISGKITRKRQYTIENSELKHVFDNNINIDDELLQEVLATESSDKMKNIVNTIQQEQNKVIRNTDDRNLIVQGIAGSGKTSVALHRIAFLLYKIENLSSNNVLIFSPNNIFSEYISNVLPELGENNTLQTTFHDFLNKKIKEFERVESFTSFVERYYKYNENNSELIKYKQSDEIITDINNYINDIILGTEFTLDIEFDHVYEYTKDSLNEMLKNRYNRFPLFERIESIATKISEMDCHGNKSKRLSLLKLLKESLNTPYNYREIFKGFFKSKYCKFKLPNSEINASMAGKIISYEDACIYVYMESLLNGFDYDTNIKQVVIDEAQDYTRLQYILIKNLFKKADFTILGDINQTINPYYKYSSLNTITDIFDYDAKYIELSKTYRSSEEIIEYTNRILNLGHTSAIRRGEVVPVIEKQETDLKKDLIKDINDIKDKSKSIAIITKNDSEVEKIYDLLHKDINIYKITSSTKVFNRNLVIIPSYIAKGLEFDSVIIYTNKDDKYKKEEKNLFYVACTRSQHRLIVYNQ